MKTIPYGRQYVGKADISETIKVLESNWLTQGPKIGEFENALKKYCGAKYAIAVSSGTAALHIACLAAGLSKNDEAITSPITFVATSNAIVYTGATPVFADIDPCTNNIDPIRIAEKITSRTAAILPVHFAGLPCDMGKIHKIAKRNKLIVIEDACHALGAQYRYNNKWVRIGSCAHSDMTVFSFHPVKLITTGEGGAVLTNCKEIYEKLMMLRSHGITKDKNRFVDKRNKACGWYYEMQELGFNYRITDFQCALGISQLKRLDKFLSRRSEIAHMYSKELDKFPGIILPAEGDGVISSWHLYPVRIHGMCRKEAFDYLRSKGIGVQVHYIPVYLQPYFSNLGYKKGICPLAEEFYITEISLPIYPLLKDREIKFIISVFKSMFKGAT